MEERLQRILAMTEQGAESSKRLETHTWTHRVIVIAYCSEIKIIKRNNVLAFPLVLLYRELIENLTGSTGPQALG